MNFRERQKTLSLGCKTMDSNKCTQKMQVIIGCKCTLLDLMEYIQPFQSECGFFSRFGLVSFPYNMWTRIQCSFVSVCLYHGGPGTALSWRDMFVCVYARGGWGWTGSVVVVGVGVKTCDALTGKQAA